jgi:2-C-methyl-D-erythritol 4-phosphate cytidylyltransferase/2-C-methyl-D-erythritol 2,4-cyclodiphosphate synthase
MSVCAIVVASGRSERFGGATPKVLASWRGRSLLAWTLDALDRAGSVDEVLLVASEEVEQAWRAAGEPGIKVRSVVRGGETRQDSVMAGAEALGSEAEVVLVHDGARPFVSPELVDAVAAAAREAGAALPLLPVVDTVKRVDGEGDVVETQPRQELFRAQTPQGFRVGILRAAQEHARATGLQATDDVALVEAARAAGALPGGQRIAGVPGEESNVKVTRPQDLPVDATTRVGYGHDVHPLVPGRRFVLAGIDLQEGAAESERFGPSGHSDGDAVTHAVCDALLGAAALGDIGRLFPDTADENEGRPSLEFLTGIVARLAEEGWRTVNVSAVLQLERPKVAPVADRIRAELARVLGLPVEQVGLSAKRGEGLGPVGEGKAVECQAVALIERSS